MLVAVDCVVSVSQPCVQLAGYRYLCHKQTSFDNVMHLIVAVWFQKTPLNVILWTDKVLRENLLLINKLMQHGRKNSDF